MICRIFEDFITDKSSYCSLKTLNKYREDNERFIAFIHQKYKADSFGQLADQRILRDYIIYLRSNGVRNVSIRSYARSIKAFLSWAYQNDLCVDYLKGVKLPKDDSKIKIPLYAAEVVLCDRTFITDTELGLRNWCIFHLMLDCGLRRQEVINLKLKEIDFDKNLITIINSKGEKSRLVLVPDFVLEKIRIYLSISGSSSEYLLMSKDGSMMTDNSVKMMFQKLKKKTGIERLHAHLLRHTFATSYLIGGGNLEFLRVFMGHCDYTVTMHYSALAAQLKMIGADVYKLDQIFFTRGY